jgi:hypothetical protein
LLNVKTLGLKLWYKVLLENIGTTEVDADGFRFNKRCKIESEHLDIDWDLGKNLVIDIFTWPGVL